MLTNHMQVLWYNWIAILILIFCYIICAIAGAAGSISPTYSFVVIWNMLLLLAYAVGGTMIVRNPRYRSPLSVGFLIGLSFMFVMSMLQVAAISGANFASLGGGELKSASQAVTAFASLLLIALTAFTTFLSLYRDTLLPPSMASTDQGTGLPPAGGFPPTSAATATSFTTYSLGQSAPGADLGGAAASGLGGAGYTDKYGMDVDSSSAGGGAPGSNVL